MLGVDHKTITRDLGENSPKDEAISIQNQVESGENSPPPASITQSGAEMTPPWPLPRGREDIGDKWLNASTI
jgi:hypothetical protein